MFHTKAFVIFALLGLVHSHKDFMDTVPESFEDEDALLLSNRKIDVDSIDFPVKEDTHQLMHRFSSEAEY